MDESSLPISAWNARRLPDETVFDRTLRGDAVAFAEVYRRYQKRVYGYCLARTLDPETASDATQEVFMKLLRAQPGSIEHPRAWLFTVARSVVIDTVRKRTRTPEDPVEPDSLAWDQLRVADTADEVLARADARNVFLALRSMRPRYRAALVMRDVHGQSAKDMAEAFQASPGAVDTLVSRARDAFGAAYALVAGLPASCRANVELIYRELGTGITAAERVSLDAHVLECERCRLEAKRARSSNHLAALLPFLVPAKRAAYGLLERAAMTARSCPDVAVAHGTAVLMQPQSLSLAGKIATGVLATAIVIAPVTATTLREERQASAAQDRPSREVLAAPRREAATTPDPTTPEAAPGGVALPTGPQAGGDFAQWSDRYARRTTPLRPTDGWTNTTSPNDGSSGTDVRFPTSGTQPSCDPSTEQPTGTGENCTGENPTGTPGSGSTDGPAPTTDGSNGTGSTYPLPGSGSGSGTPGSGTFGGPESWTSGDGSWAGTGFTSR